MIDWDEYARDPLPFAAPDRVSYQELSDFLDGLDQGSDGSVSIDVIGESVEGRPLRRVRIGNGPRHVALWSQMHGDEPTHTVVLADLLQLLAGDPSSDQTRGILSGCSLTLFPMVNPDGAERWSRYNSRGIDINRDALRTITPEARTLRRMITEDTFDFAFNLHNQHANTTVDGTRPAIVSLLVPPVDPDDTQTPSVNVAKRVAGRFLRTIQPHCEKAISRYDADYMPRCFGEWIQARQISSVLIEAGDCPHDDPRWLPWLHFQGLLSTLRDIAAGGLADEDASLYESLPRSSPHRVFDLMLRGTYLPGDESAAGKPIDVGINLLQNDASGSAGTIVDIGDLCVTTGRRLIAGNDLVAVPGRIVYDESIRPNSTDLETRLVDLAKCGVTSVVGCVELDDDDAPRQMEQLRRLHSWATNLGFVGRLSGDQVQSQRVIILLQPGVLGLIVGEEPEDKGQLPMTHQELVGFSRQPLAVSEWQELSQRMAARVGLADRGQLRRNYAADIVTLSAASDSSHGPAAEVRHVVVNGVLTIQEGVYTNANAGRLLQRGYGLGRT